MKPKLLSLLLVILLAPIYCLSQNIYINEVVSSNSSTIADEDGDYADWIEIYNNGSASINLNEYGLSDDYEDPFRWIFPDVELNPGAFLIVWASGKDHSDSSDQLHTNYAISKDGEEITLTHPNGERLDEMSSTTIPTDHSFGRFPDGDGEWRLFDNTTPGEANSNSSWSGITSAPEFSREAGFHDGPFELQLSTSDPDARIYYTTDGSDPTTSSNEYDKPITIENREGDPNILSDLHTTATGVTWEWQPPKSNVFKGNVVKAIAVSGEKKESEVAASSYFVHPEINNLYSFPVLSIQTARDNLFSDESGIFVPGDTYTNHRLSGNYFQRGIEWEHEAHLELFEKDGTRKVSQNVGLRIHGGASRRYSQKAIRIYARSEYDSHSDIPYEVFPGHRMQGDNKLLNGYKRLILRSSGDDWDHTMFKDAMIQSLYEDLKIDRQAYRPSVVFINGEYWGIHNIRERYDQWYIETNYDIDREDVVILENNAGVDHGLYSDRAHYADMREYAIREDLSQAEHYEYINTLMDVDNYLEYLSIQIFASNSDWPHNNVRYWRKKTPSYEPDASYGADGRWRWMIFDMDGSLGFPYLTDDWARYDQNMFEWVSGKGNPRNPGDWVNALFNNLIENQEFRNKLITLFADHLNTRFSTNHVKERINHFHELYQPEIEEHIDRHPGSSGGSISNWEGYIETFLEFAENRPGHLRSHIRNYFNVDEASLMVKLSDNAGGFVTINSTALTGTTPGVSSQPYPWSGIYFKGVPVEINSTPWPGYQFSHWMVDGEQVADKNLQLTMLKDTEITAVFTEDDNAVIFPEPHIMTDGAYTFTGWPADADPGSYPPNMAFIYMDEEDPTLGAEIEGHTSGVFNLDNRTRINGWGESGFSFINTGNPEGNPGYPGSRLGGAILAFDSRGRDQVNVSWTGGTLKPNSRIYNLRLQYRIGDAGPFIDVKKEQGEPVEYRRNEQSGHTEQFESVVLPAQTGNKPYVQLRWLYYYTEQRLDEENGQRSMLSVSDIFLDDRAVSAEENEDLTKDYKLNQNYPNPFNPATEITYSLPEPTEVILEVYSIHGQRLAVLESGLKSEGEHSVNFDASNLASGMYIYRLQAGEVIESKKMILLK